MAPPKSPAPIVEETTPYQNLVDARVKEPEPYDIIVTNKTAKQSLYPHKLNIHLRSKKDALAFAKLIRRKLESDKKAFVFKAGSTTKPENWIFVEKRKNPARRSTSHTERLEAHLWKDTIDFSNNPKPTYITFSITFRSEKQYSAFARLVKQRLSLQTQYIYFPRATQEWSTHIWKSSWNEVQPHYPIYIVSKGRADSRKTSVALERMGVPYFIVIEPQDYDAYSCLIDEEKILVLPFSNHGDGPGRARNWCWDHSISLGAKRHWVLDDNITRFLRLHENKRIAVADGGIFQAAEDFVDRFSNVRVAGFNYRFFIEPLRGYTPFIINTRIYSCLLIENSCKHRWRGRYNEDTILSLDVLKDGDCTIQFNAFLQEKLGTQVLGGGNTEEFYDEEGTFNKSAMLEAIHPDVAKIVWRFGRWHHHVDYSSFKNNQAILKKTYPKRKKGYPMSLVPISDPK